MSREAVDQAVRAFREGRFVVIVDDRQREDEGDLCIAAEWATPEAVNFMTREARGLVCVALTPERLADLGLSMMVPEEENTALLGTAFTVSVDARDEVTTGISAYDRARTIQALVDPETRPKDLARPGHIFPLRAEPEGVLARPGHTEAVVDLARLAGLKPAGVICEIMAEDGTMARGAQLLAFAARHGIPVLRVADLVGYRRGEQRPAAPLSQLPLLELARTRLPTRHGEFEARLFRELGRVEEVHVALLMGELPAERPALVRVHSECLTGDALGSVRCDCGAQLQRALQLIAREGSGVVLYLRQEGRGIGLANKLRAYALQDQGLDTVEANHQLGLPADAREYGVAARMLRQLGVERVRLLTNNPAKRLGLEDHGIQVVERISLRVASNRESERYLEVKRRKLGHLL